MLGPVSIWYGRPGGPARYARAEHEPHVAASLMKLPVLVALYRSVDAGRLHLDEPVGVRNEFASVVGGTFGLEESHDSDPAVWAGSAGPRPLAGSRPG